MLGRGWRTASGRGGGAEWAPPTTPGTRHVSSEGRTGSTDERERQPEIRDCFADVGETASAGYATACERVPAKQAVRMRANPPATSVAAVFVSARDIMFGLLSTRRE